MGLSGRKEKQRIPVDPRNLTWADDAAKFGSNYLSKFGWDSSKGLGVDGDGRKSHIKVSHKLDMLGIGAAHQKDSNGIAWKQNEDFENLLKRLNESRAVEEVDVVAGNIEIAVEDDIDKGGRKHKRKRGGSQEVREGMAKTKRKKTEDEDIARAVESKNSSLGLSVMDTPSLPQKSYIPRHRAHRARAIASKSIVSKSAIAIAEILGIAPTSSTSSTPSSSATPQGKLTPLDDGLTVEKITTSTKCVADYFKDKLLAKSSKSSPNKLMGTPEPGISDEQDSFDTPRRGLGFPHLRLNDIEVDTQTRRIGISKFSSSMSSSFLASTVSITTLPKEFGTASHSKPSDNDISTENPGEASDKDEQKIDMAKEERRRARAERRALKQKKAK